MYEFQSLYIKHVDIYGRDSNYAYVVYDPFRERYLVRTIKQGSHYLTFNHCTSLDQATKYVDDLVANWEDW